MAKIKVDISEAQRALGLRHKVYIQYTPHRKLQLSPEIFQRNYFAFCVPDATTGDHVFRRDFRFTQPYHWIRLSKSRWTTLILAHELIHAQQAERFPDPQTWREYYLSLRDKFTYWLDPIEVEARERAPEIAPLIIGDPKCH